MKDPAWLAARFDAALRARGVIAGTRRAGTFADTLRILPPHGAEGLYWRARAAMLPSIGDLEAFHAAYVEFFGTVDEADALHRLVRTVNAPPPAADAPKRASLPPPPSERPAAGADAEHAPTQWIAASLEERMGDAAFEDLDDAERATILRLIGRVRIAADARRSRRRRAHPHGDRFDFRATLRGAARTAGELV
ncbi:MAG: hypothetical protein JWN27_1804, partial [Candidatus Eremiobacteraeota bacterium]|nr:hypothetical protein [Candidatus Eremiobacteraeota bacterium]